MSELKPCPMTKEQAAGKLQESYDYMTRVIPDGKRSQATIDTLAALLCAIDVLGRAQPANARQDIPTLLAEDERLQQAQRWIPVTESLPEIYADNCSKNVLIAVRYATDLPYDRPTICCGYYLDGSWWSYSEHNCNEIGEKWEGDVVTHWTTLPEPPKEDLNGRT